MGKKRALDVIAHSHLFEAIRNNDDVSLFDVFGANASIGTAANETIWGVGGLYIEPTAATVLVIQSTSAEDTTAGSGALTVQVIGVGQNYSAITEIVTLAGTATTALTLASFRAVNRLVVLTSGPANINVGTLVASQQTSGPTLASVLPGESVSHACIYTVPNGKAAIVFNLDVNTGRDGAGTNPLVTLSVYSKVRIAAATTDFLVVKEIIDTTVTTNYHLEYPFVTPQIAGTRIELVAGTDKANTQVSGRFILALYDATALF